MRKLVERAVTIRRYAQPQPTEFHAMSRIARIVIVVLSAMFSLAACAPEVGSDRWCANLKEKPKGDWSINEATDYAKHCIFK
jgi:hypothetical protein